MSSDHVDAQIVAAIRDEAYSAPLDLDPALLRERLTRDGRRWPLPSLARIAAVLVVVVALAGLVYGSTIRPGPFASATAETCAVSDVIRYEGSWWYEIGGPGAYFHATPNQFYAPDEMTRWRLITRFDPAPSPGEDFAVWADHLASGQRTDAAFNSPMDPRNIYRFDEAAPALPGSWYLFEQALPQPGCWQLTAAVGGQVVGRATIDVAEAETRRSDDPNAATPEIAPTPMIAPTPSTAVTSAIPMCRDLVAITAPAENYRDEPIYVGNPPDNEVREWALRKPGFEVLWIDREHNGWLTLAFTSDASERQREIEAELPGVGAVAVEVDWTMRELERLQQRARDELGPAMFASGILVTKGVVSVFVGALTADRIAVVESRLGGERVCIDGVDPADVPPEGPQPQSGEGWRLLADADGVGPAYRTGIAYDAESYAELWRTAELAGTAPHVAFETEVAIWFGVVTGSICAPIRMDDVVIERTRSVIHPLIVHTGFGGCTDDIHPHAYVVALERARLPEPPFWIQLDAGGPPGGAPEERTVVDAGLSVPGSVAEPGEVHSDPSLPEPHFVQPGDSIEPGYPVTYRQSSHCGLEWLGPLNDVNWRTPEANASDWIPVEWTRAIEDEFVTLRILMTADPPRLRATANGHTVTYEATTEDAPGCD